ncbi:class I SAM-dependent RNA methyltransferase [Sediminicoccus sp. BL-A-41-H5]|uniref:class I SAM-dependent RNA methyltransferase n=1 Tax=Sediminicoccus sp. BL-A-41-H5 TaxID=3421106 RepID=UPI003D6670C7
MLELTVTQMGAAGDGIAPLPDGGAAFVSFTLPGERVAARVAGKDRAVLESIVLASPDRVEPPCRHFTICGGCALQHWDAPPYAEWKRGRLAEALSRAGYADPDVAPMVATPRAVRQRADLGLERLTDGRVEIGFHERGATHLVPMRECHVMLPSLVALLPALQDALRGLNALKRLGSAVINWLDTGADILLRTDAPLTMADRKMLADFAARAGIPRIAWAGKGAPAEVAAQVKPVRHMLSGIPVSPPPGAFLQASAEGEAAIIAAVLAGLPKKLSPRARIADLYAGIGTLSFPLAANHVVHAYEGDPAAAEALRLAVNAAQASRVQPARRDLVRQPLLPAELKAFATVVLDPPFAGAAEQVAQIARSTLPHLIYVSCSPAALGRDAGTLREAGFRLVSATPVDQFLWSPHLESVVVFAR